MILPVVIYVVDLLKGGFYVGLLVAGAVYNIVPVILFTMVCLVVKLISYFELRFRNTQDSKIYVNIMTPPLIIYFLFDLGIIISTSLVKSLLVIPAVLSFLLYIIELGCVIRYHRQLRTHPQQIE